MHIIQEISPTGSLSPQHLTSSMSPAYTDVPIKNPRHLKSVPILKQDQCIKVCYIRTGLETL